LFLGHFELAMVERAPFLQLDIQDFNSSNFL